MSQIATPEVVELSVADLSHEGSMEQAPVSTTCRVVNPTKGPGVMGRWSHQAVAQGSDAVLYFQMRTAPGASEMWFGGVLDHRGRTDTRTYRETQALGAELAEAAKIGRASCRERV